MVKLVDLILEDKNKPKMVIMSGGAGAGKSTLLNKLKPSLSNFEIINPDKYVEDKDSPMFNNLTKASNQVDDKDVPAAIQAGKNFVWDTTASNAAKMLGGTYRRKEVPGILNTGDYDHLMIMVYAHPIVSFLRNFERERKVPKIGVLSTWNNVYGNIDRYKSKLGDNFILYRAPDSQYEKEIKDFEAAVKAGKLKEYLEELTQSNPEKFASTFRKPEDPNLSPEEKAKKEKQRLASKQQLDAQIDKLEKEFLSISEKVKGMVATEDTIKQKVKSFINS